MTLGLSGSNSNYLFVLFAAESPEFLPQPESPGCQTDANNTPAVTDTLETSLSSVPVDLQSQVGKSITSPTNIFFVGYGSETLGCTKVLPSGSISSHTLVITQS